MNDDNAELLTAVRAMSGEAKGLRSELEAVKKAGKRNRNMIILTIASLILDVGLTFGLGWNIHKTNETSDKTDAVASTEAEVCKAINDRNKSQRTLWDVFFAQVPLEGQTPEEKLRRQADLREAVTVAFTPVSCPED